MKRVLALFIIGISISLVFSAIALRFPGNVYISTDKWLIESNLWLMAVVIFFLVPILAIALKQLFSALYFTITIKSKLKNKIKPQKNWFPKTGIQRANLNTENGLMALLEGNWGNANKLLSRSANKSQKPIINYLAAAHAANELGQIKDAEQLLKKAYDSTPDSEFAVGIAQAQIQFQQAQYEPCLATLLRLKKQQANHPFVIKLLKAVYLKLEDWQQVIELIPALKKETKIDIKTLSELESSAWNKLFIQKADELDHRSQQDSATEILALLWQKVPDHLRFDTSLLETYAHQLIRLKQPAACETLLRKVLKKGWDDRLVSIYGKVEGGKISEQLIHAENWLKERPNNAVLLLALGRLSLRNELWGKALEYFEASKRLQENRESLAELCRLSMRMKPSKDNTQAEFEALIESLSLPDLPLPAIISRHS